jgi:hypothetical protein
MSDQDKELWVDLYRMAMMEMENAKIAGRIGDARVEIATRLEKLREIPGLHTVEKQALDDALSALRSLERIEERGGDDERRLGWQSTDEGRLRSNGRLRPPCYA